MVISKHAKFEEFPFKMYDELREKTFNELLVF